jgi:NAD(P)-dependent dehydrogenase (short-subunit alcohol dehydrogenase family)
MGSAKRMGSLDGEVALVTGGASGLGLAIVRNFIAEGACVAVLDRAAHRLPAVTEEFGPAVIGVAGDVTAYDDNARAVAQTVAAFGKLSIFVGNAGVYDNHAALATIDGAKLGAAFDELLGVNVKGYLLGVRAAHDELKRTHGSVVLTGSISSFFAGYGGVLYITAKHAIVGMTRQLAQELAPEIRVNAVAPGAIPSNLAGLRALDQGPYAPPTRTDEDYLLKATPEAGDYAPIYAFLASRAAAKVLTGAVVLADGGGSLRKK